MGWVYASWWQAMIPLATLTAFRIAGRRFSGVWWAVAAALGVSWVSDATALAIAPAHRWLPSLVYPVVQGMILAFAFLPRKSAWQFTGALCVVLGAALLQLGPWHPDSLVRTIAWIGGGVLGWQRPHPRALRWCLVVTFGLGWAVWLWHATFLDVPSWYVYQGVRAVGIGIFVAGAVHARRTIAPAGA